VQAFICKKYRLTTLHVSNEAENGEPQLQKKRGDIKIIIREGEKNV